jgi:phosphoribosylanthranilate isomerase
MPVKIKICGIKTIQDMQCAVHYGADAMGLVFVPGSSRCVSISQALAITKACPPFLIKVGLFVNASADLIQDHLKILNLDLLQFHGDEDLEPNDFCKKFNKPFIKALKINSKIQHQDTQIQIILKSMSNYPDAAGFLLDSFDPNFPDQHGGTGKNFNWEIFKNIKSPKPLILAGGLTPENIQEAIKATQPYAVDVSSGVASAPGIKSPEKIQKFCEQVRDL